MQRFAASPKPVSRSIAWCKTPTGFCESTLATNSRLSSWTSCATMVRGVCQAPATPVLHIHGDGATPKDSTGVPLGCSVTPRFPVHRLTLTHGDTLFLYTDGLTEARNRAGAEYGLHESAPWRAARRDRACGLLSECLKDRWNLGRV